jgi:hypothetical protein
MFGDDILVCDSNNNCIKRVSLIKGETWIVAGKTYVNNLRFFL